MPKLIRWAAIVAMVVLSLGPMGTALAAPLEPADAPTAATAAVNEDDEIILVLSTGYIRVEDPHTATGYEAATWTSPAAGWTFVTTGDFNGDGDDEIVALGGARAKIYDPFPVGGTTVTLEVDAGSEEWLMAVAGDIDLDGRDELILQRTDSGTYAARVIIYDGNATGTSWSILQDKAYGAQWLSMALGNFVGDARQELVLTREPDNLLFVMNAQTGEEISRTTPGQWFVRLATGDVNRDGRDEILAVRDVLSPGSCLVVYRVKGVGQDLEVIDANVKVGLAFTWVTAGDYDKDGADEMALLRNLESPYNGLFGRDLVSPYITLNQVIGTGWTDMQSGDADGDGRDEIYILKSSLVRGYSLPVSISYSKAGSFGTSLALGNVDGAGLVSGPTLQVTPASLSYQMEFRGPNPAAKTVSVSNSTGSDVIHWTATESPAVDWLSITPTSGNSPGSFQVSINGAVAPAGDLTTQIIVAGGTGVRNSPVTINVSLKVIGPILSVSPTSLSFAMDYGNPAPAAKLLQIDNTAGSQALAWTARTEPAVDWLALTPSSGNSPSTLEVSVVAAAVVPGTITTNVIIDAGASASGSPFSVPVTVQVRAPQMQFSPRSITVFAAPGAAVPPKAIRVTQLGGGSAINWIATIVFKADWDALVARGDAVEEVHVTENGLDAVVDGEEIHIAAANWLAVFPTSGTTPADVNVTFDTNAVPLGTYQATVIVDGGAGVIDRLGACDVKMVLIQPVSFLPLVVTQH